MSLFFPKQIAFFDLLLDVNGHLIEMVELLDEFGKNFNDFEGYSVRAKHIEHKTHTKTHEIITTLNKTFITPIDREDIYLLAHQLDDIVAIIGNIIHNIHLYRVTQKFYTMEKFVSVIKETGYYLKDLLFCLKQQRYTDELVNVKIKIHELEDKADNLFAQAICNLFVEEKDSIMIIKLKDILESLERVMDKFQKIADIIEGIIVKST